MKKCLICYKEIDDGKSEFHISCSKKIFGFPSPPGINWGLDELYSKAAQIVRKSVTIPGVQPKLSLEIEENMVQVGLLLSKIITNIY